MIILVGSQKGGCGKSTVAINISVSLAADGRDVVLVDADRQMSSSRFIEDRRADPKRSPVHIVQMRDNIRDTLLDLDKRYEFVVVDVAGHDSSELRSGMTAADLLLVPFIPSNMDLDTIKSLGKVITEARFINPDLKVAAVLAKVPTNPSIHEEREAREYLSDYPEFPVCRSVIRERKIYRDILPYGLGVVESRNSKAKAEVQLLVQEILGG